MTIETAASLDPNHLLPLGAAARALGITAQTARNQIYTGRFPVRTYIVRRRRYVRAADLAAHLTGLVPVGVNQ